MDLQGIADKACTTCDPQKFHPARSPALVTFLTPSFAEFSRAFSKSLIFQRSQCCAECDESIIDFSDTTASRERSSLLCRPPMENRRSMSPFNGSGLQNGIDECNAWFRKSSSLVRWSRRQFIRRRSVTPLDGPSCDANHSTVLDRSCSQRVRAFPTARGSVRSSLHPAGGLAKLPLPQFRSARRAPHPRSSCAIRLRHLRAMRLESRSKPNCPPGSNPVSPQGLCVTFPDAAAMVAKNALAAFRTDQQLQSPIDDLAFAFQAGELSRFTHQVLVDVDVGSHGTNHTHFVTFWCMISPSLPSYARSVRKVDLHRSARDRRQGRALTAGTRARLAASRPPLRC